MWVSTRTLYTIVRVRIVQGKKGNFGCPLKKECNSWEKIKRSSFSSIFWCVTRLRNLNIFGCYSFTKRTVVWPMKNNILVLLERITTNYAAAHGIQLNSKKNWIIGSRLIVDPGRRNSSKVDTTNYKCFAFYS